MKRKLIFTAMAALLTISLSSAAAHADTVNFTLTQTSASVSALSGGTVTFDATVLAPLSNGAEVFLNTDSANISGPPILDDTDFFLNFPASLNPGDSAAGDIFTITVAPGTPLGTYLGSFTLQGGADNLAQDDLGTVSFAVYVTPEPSSLLLLTTGAGALFGRVRRRLK